MSNLYFTQFPQITYDSYPAINLLTRVVFRKKLRESFENYFLYTIPDGQTAQQLAQDYYGDPTNDILIWLINDIVDPYYGWPLNQKRLDNYIIEKYGSLQVAQLKILNWESNWFGNEDKLTIAGYQALVDNDKQFWTPVIRPGNVLLNYKRNKQNLAVTTNMYGQLIYTSNVAPFNVGDVITDANNGTTTAEVCWANSTQLTIKNVLGQWYIANNYNIQNVTDFGNITTVPVMLVSLNPVIPAAQAVYFSPISVYDYEHWLNQQKSYIRLLHSDYLTAAQALITQALQANYG